MTKPVPPLFVEALASLSDWLQNAGVPAMVIGGVAASILGRPRATRDIDALTIVDEDRWAALLAAAADHGIAPRIDNPLPFARRTRVLLMRHLPSAVDIDVILGRLPFEEEAVKRAEWHDLGGVRVRLPQVEDLLIMKAIAQRPQDLRDIEGLLDVYPNADVQRVRSFVRDFGTGAAMPDLLKPFELLLDQRSLKPRR